MFCAVEFPKLKRSDSTLRLSLSLTSSGTVRVCVWRCKVFARISNTGPPAKDFGVVSESFLVRILSVCIPTFSPFETFEEREREREQLIGLQLTLEYMMTLVHDC